MVWENLNENAMPLLEGVILMNDYTLLVSRSSKLDYARDHLNELFGRNIRAISAGNMSATAGIHGRTGCDQLYFRHDQLFQRSDDSLPRIVVEYPVRF